MNRRLRVLILLVLLTVPAGVLQAQGRWWHRSWRCRRLVEAVPPKVSAFPGPDAAYFELYGQGRLKEDGSDVRVVADGRLLGQKLLHVSPTGIARILFLLVPGTTTT